MDIAAPPRDVWGIGFGWAGAITGSPPIDIALLTLLILALYMAGRTLIGLSRRASYLWQGLVVAVSLLVGSVTLLVGAAVEDAHSSDREAARTCSRLHDFGAPGATVAEPRLHAMQEWCRDVTARQAAEARRLHAESTIRLLGEKALAGLGDPATAAIALALMLGTWFGLSRLARRAVRKRVRATRTEAEVGDPTSC